MGDVAEEIFNSLGSDNGAAEGAAAGGAGEVPSMMPGGDFKMPTMEEFLSMLEGMDNLSDEEKEELKAGIMKNSLRNRLQAGLSDYLVFFVMLSIMLAVFDKLRQAFADASLEEREKLLEAIKSFSKLPDMTDELPNLLQKIQQQALKKAMQYRHDHQENPFVEALDSVALRELLQDDEKRSLAEQFQQNLRTLSDMFVNLSDEEKRQFAKDFKGKFVKSLAHLNEFSKQKKIAQSAAGREEEVGGGSLARILPGVGMLVDDQFSPTPIGYGVFLCLLVFVIAFFGYKLYLSLTEKERKREEKLKAKQEKSKKKK
uniref:Uncharacterized protein n=1 Tax=Anopheles atroparvus TaxID=41427 RepID=A0A182JK34_ANOAO